MFRYVMPLVAVLVCNLAFADQWYEENFKANATDVHRAMALRSDITPPHQRDYKCPAITNALVKNTALFVTRDQKATCFEDGDCGVGSLGGFCAVAVHQTQLEGYKLWTRSPAYAHLSEEYKDAKCHGPMGMCLPVNRAFCEKPSPTQPGVCKAKWDKPPTHTAETIFMKD